MFMTSFCALHSQIIDDFSSSGGILSPEWVGDRDKFTITEDGALQLQDSISGSALLFRKTRWQEKMNWQIYLEMNFNPSRNNRLDIYLFSNSMDLENASAFVLRIGENGSDDALTLIDLQNGEERVLAKGAEGSLAQGPIRLRMDILFNNGKYLFRTDTTGSLCLIDELEIEHDSLPHEEEFYFGWNCTYTSSRSDEFFFDDIYVGAKTVDDTAPSVISYSAQDSEVQFNFSELIDTNSFSNAIIEVTPVVQNLSSSLSKSTLILNSSAGFDHSAEYEIYLSGITDLSGNFLDTLLEIFIPRTPISGDLLVNEILFNPIENGSDFVELVNQSDDYISLTEVSLENKSNEKGERIISPPSIAPGAYVVFTDDRNDILNRYTHHDPQVIYETDIPPFNNTGGNVSISVNGEILDSFDYDEDFHHPLLDDVEGLSLARISLDEETDNPENWTSSSGSTGFASPGLPNGFGIVSAQNVFEIEDKVFSPNGDGDKDILQVNYSLESSEYVGNIRVFNEYGKLVKTLLTNELLSSGGIVQWDGRTEDGSLAPLGIYILHIEIYQLDGRREQIKLTFAVGDFIN